MVTTSGSIPNSLTKGTKKMAKAPKPKRKPTTQVGVSDAMNAEGEKLRKKAGKNALPGGGYKKGGKVKKGKKK